MHKNQSVQHFWYYYQLIALAQTKFEVCAHEKWNEKMLFNGMAIPSKLHKSYEIILINPAFGIPLRSKTSSY